MKTATDSRAKAARGFTLLELLVALSIFAVLGYSITVAVGAGRQTERTVMQVSSDDRDLRKTTDSLIADISSTRDSLIAVTALPDGNAELRFMQPIQVAGALTWGAYDRTLGEDPDTQNQPGWFVQYTVRNVPAGNGTIVKQLVRQILDDALSVQKEKVLADALCAGGGSAPGFNVIKVGDVWELTVSTQRSTERKATTQVFHVRTRN